MMKNRIKAARLFTGLSQKELGEHCGLTQQAIAKIELGKSTQPRALSTIARILRVSPEWIEYGLNPPKWTSDENLLLGLNIILDKNDTFSISNKAQQKDLSNVEEASITNTGRVPLISWVQAGAWNQAEEQNEAEEYLPCPVNHSDNTYALTVKGDSMTAPHGRSYPEGAIIYVDPDAAGNVTTGDRVIAKVNGDDAVTFKVYIEDGGKKYLKALNPSYPILTDEFRILGKIIGMWVPE